MNTPSGITKPQSPNRDLLNQIFQHEKCGEFNQIDTSNIKKAIVFALWAHRHQKRQSNVPYMDHIRGAVGDYLSISQKTKLKDKDIIIMILHDAVEDRPKCMSKLLDVFGYEIYIPILELSKGSSDTLVGQFSIMTKAIMMGGTPVVSNLMSYIIGKMTTITSIPSHSQCAIEIMSLWPLMMNDLRNYQFLWKIYALSEDQFERKTADRMNNLNDLTHVSIGYIEKNIRSTSIYIAKAKALGRGDLVSLLEGGMKQLKSKKSEIET